MLKHHEAYPIRRELVQMFIKSFFKVLWNKESNLWEKLILDCLVGTPNEVAFLEVRNNEVCAEMNLSPLIRPRKRFRDEDSDVFIEVFVNHIDAAS